MGSLTVYDLKGNVTYDIKIINIKTFYPIFSTASRNSLFRINLLQIQGSILFFVTMVSTFAFITLYLFCQIQFRFIDSDNQYYFKTSFARSATLAHTS